MNHLPVSSHNSMQISAHSCSYMGLNLRKSVSGICKQQRRRQLAQSRILISAFIICFLESIILKLATSKISAQETGLSLAFSETLKTGFVPLRPNYEHTEFFWGCFNALYSSTLINFLNNWVCYPFLFLSFGYCKC